MDFSVQAFANVEVISVLAVTFVATVGLFTIYGGKMSIISYYVRVLISFLCLIICALYGVIASIALRIFGYGGLSQWTVARSFKYSMKLAAGVECQIQDEHWLRTRPAVFIGNHQTYVVPKRSHGHPRLHYADCTLGSSMY